jgi:hypothetical protein
LLATDLRTGAGTARLVPELLAEPGDPDGRVPFAGSSLSLVLAGRSVRRGRMSAVSRRVQRLSAGFTP